MVSNRLTVHCISSSTAGKRVPDERCVTSSKEFQGKPISLANPLNVFALLPLQTYLYRPRHLAIYQSFRRESISSKPPSGREGS